MQNLLKKATQQLRLARRPPSSSASALDRSLPFETDIGTVFSTPAASDDDSGEFGDSMDMDMDMGMDVDL
jgi:hypothetical protein